MPKKKSLAKAVEKQTEEGQDSKVGLDFSPEGALHKRLVSQIDAEWNLAWQFMQPKIKEWNTRLRLYTNQKREKDKVGDPLMFTIHQTVLASLCEDRLSVEFGGREEGDEDRAESWNSLAEFDYDEMQKNYVDYEWNWDASFFGRGLVLLNDFNRKSLTPMPEVLDPLNLLRDPRAVSVNGLQGRGGARFFFREVRLTKGEMKRNPAYFNLDKLKKTGSDLKSLTADSKQARRDAQGLENTEKWESSLDENFEYTICQAFTHVDGEKYLLELGNDRKLVVRATKITFDVWPVIDRTIYPIAHDWDGVSIPDLTEDKQRIRAVLINLGVDVAKADLYPMYLFDTLRISRQQDLNFEFNKMIPVDGPVGDDVFRPVQKNKISQQTDYILSLLDLAAQKATATPDIQQGLPSQKDRTLGEVELAAQRSNTRYSLSAKIFGWSEKDFWLQHYRVYEKNFKSGIDKKVLRLVGAFGPKWYEVKREDLIFSHPLGPDIKIESRVLSEAKKARMAQGFNQYLQMAMLDPDVRLKYALRKAGRLIGLKKDEVERMIPPTVDEMIAEEENEQLNENTIVPVKLEDDHYCHLEVHSKANLTPALEKHIRSHRKALMAKKQIPQIFPGYQDPSLQQGQPGPGQASAPRPLGQPSQPAFNLAGPPSEGA